MKVYKVELLIVDHDKIGETGITEAIENVNFPNDCISPNVMAIEVRDIGEWDDDNPLNNLRTMNAEYKKLFNP